MHTEYKQGKAYCYFAWEFVQKAFLAQVFRILNQSGTFPDYFLERLHTFGSLVLLLLKIKLRYLFDGSGNHIGNIFFRIEAAIHHGLTPSSCTSLLAKRNIPKLKTEAEVVKLK